MSNSHLAEAQEEIDFMLAKYGKRSLAWAMELELLGSDVWFAHGNYFTDEEYEIIGKSVGSIAYCPIPQMMLGSRVLDLSELELKGINIGLGTDGYGVQDSSNLIEVLRMAYLLQCNSRGLGRTLAPTAYDCLKKATVNGAKILGRDDIGSLVVNKAADMFLIDVSPIEMVGALEDPSAFLAKAGYHNHVYMTFINGVVVYRDGKLQNINEDNIAQDANQVYQKNIKKYE
ncbi:hypothetical protein AZF37_02190 [endosymbiont 'TC1' of Trimyema compressum]|uniref:amidohydrolase family protein n=1 Tax=endosymbiont 'TC1' of Trimyema compressum TaxID=243899 RepID=UPI0007F160DE|nr:amidohydrolase family protein [endosymbiont 'TC1' of Trimyema compressum]AMP20139.1 hypothetical protein AZF37_02190 [endosymbiont 'TC1' of Trimyema compressum]